MAVRVVIVDDSSLVRGLLREALSDLPGMEVVGEAADGLAALAVIKRLRPDVVTMDVLMPIMGGPESIRRVMAECPTPIVVFAAAQTDQRLAWQALEYGAAEVFAKPTSGLDPATVASLAAALRRAAGARVGRRTIPAAPRARLSSSASAGGRPVAALGIVGSTGAPQVLQQILRALPADFPWPIAIVQHTLRGFTESLVSWLANYTSLDIDVATQGRELRRGLVLVAPDDAHLEIDGQGRAQLDSGPGVDGHRPSATVLLRSLAASFGPRAAGLVLTGMGRDGAEGAGAIEAGGGLMLVEEPSTAMLASMPGEALHRAPRAVREEAGRLGLLLTEMAGGRR
jgi:two-component system chemotaxis response regulator CheB